MGEFLGRVRQVARDCGYAVAVHGSEKRDLDLIAAPWTAEAVSADQLVATLCERVPLHARPGNVYDDGRVTTNPEPKAWGRWAWSLAGCPEHEYVDLSVAPRAGEPVPLIPFELYDRTAPCETCGGAGWKVHVSDSRTGEGIPCPDCSPNRKDG